MVPIPTDGADGVTEMAVSVAAETVRVAFPAMLPDVAVMVADPAATPVASPAVLTVAIVVVDELQVTDEVISCVVPSE